ncbi:restriction endonuclease subunit S [Cedecea sp. FDAARGOS_727]|uniref:restriction endonuclease subunit S n=1 Tax=Cedecea sp. FDAARGOS_727 TaxID=2545798 RepID=UPI00143E23F5|nr:restriction endonuclease subunit S [Cedecea sp. FDAARGOS_727]QIX96283.1 restriction endonuclease subunit S [Cedecea sp. FDAARGOS_727]
MKNKTLKPGWNWVKFGDVVRLSKSKSKDPLVDGFERYVGLEHLEPGDLRVRSYGNVADGVTFTSVFQPGQVLFGKRRAYQRKVAVADFSGVCSGDIYVLETKDPQILLPELLPFICQTEAFFEHAVGTSAGSLSPRTNWASLASFEFILPSIATQTKIVKVLRAMESLVCIQTNALECAYTMRSALVEDTLESYSRTNPVKSLGYYLLSLSYGSSSRSSYNEKGYPILRIPNVLRGKVDYSDIQRIEISEREYERLGLRKGDVLLVRTNGNPEYVGRSVVIEHPDEKTVFASYLIRLRCDEDKLRPAFLTEFLNALSTRRKLRGEVKSSAGNYNINIAGIKKQPICAPRIEDQDNLLAQLKRLDNAIEALELRIIASKSIKRRLLENLWGH